MEKLRLRRDPGRLMGFRMQLYRFRYSPFARKVQMLLDLLGKHYELVGQKDIRWLRPLRTFTYLPAEILDGEHRRVATCETAFDLKHDLWSFLRSFRPLT